MNYKYYHILENVYRASMNYDYNGPLQWHHHEDGFRIFFKYDRFYFVTDDKPFEFVSFLN